MRSLTANQFETLEALAETMVPTDDLGPGAREARVARYIDEAIGPVPHRDRFIEGLEAADEYALATRSARIVDLSPEQCAALLTEIQQNRATGFPTGSAAFFGALRSLVLEGMFSDPSYGGNAAYIGWKLIGYPGHLLEVTVEEQQVDTRVVPVYERPGYPTRSDR